MHLQFGTGHDELAHLCVRESGHEALSVPQLLLFKYRTLTECLVYLKSQV